MRNLYQQYDLSNTNMALELTSTDSKEYEALTEDDNAERFMPFELRVQKNEAGSRNLIRLLTGTIAVLCAAVFLLSYRLWSLPVPLHSENGVNMKFHPYDFSLNIEVAAKPCGTTPAEAVERGCYFDLVRTQWLPQACNDPELNEVFRRAVEGIPHYRDKEGRIPISIDEMMWDEVDTVIYTTVDWHRHHCAFTLVKLHRAIMAGASIDSYMDVGHTTHCALWLMNNTRPWNDLTMTITGSGFPDCVTLEQMRKFEKDMAATLEPL
jgi:hypothetical protein